MLHCVFGCRYRGSGGPIVVHPESVDKKEQLFDFVDTGGHRFSVIIKQDKKNDEWMCASCVSGLHHKTPRPSSTDAPDTKGAIIHHALQVQKVATTVCTHPARTHSHLV
jgi:hypothetical protein